MENRRHRETQKKLNFYLDIFVKLKSYKDDIPEGLLTVNDPDYEFYKCRANFFSAVALYLNLVMQDRLLSKAIITKALDFIQFNKDRNFIKNVISSEDITYVNQVLDLVITELSTHLS